MGVKKIIKETDSDSMNICYKYENEALSSDDEDIKVDNNFENKINSLEEENVTLQMVIELVEGQT